MPHNDRFCTVPMGIASICYQPHYIRVCITARCLTRKAQCMQVIVLQAEEADTVSG